MEVCVKNLSKAELQVSSLKRSTRLSNPLARLIKRKKKADSDY